MFRSVGRRFRQISTNREVSLQIESFDSKEMVCRIWPALFSEYGRNGHVFVPFQGIVFSTDVYVGFVSVGVRMLLFHVGQTPQHQSVCVKEGIEWSLLGVQNMFISKAVMELVDFKKSDGWVQPFRWF